jgi:hypothetical protein
MTALQIQNETLETRQVAAKMQRLMAFAPERSKYALRPPDAP